MQLRSALAVCLAVCALAPALFPASSAGQTPALNAYGALAALGENALEIVEDGGARKSYALDPGYKVFRSRPASVADIKPNDFVASAAEPQPDGTLHSTELRIFPEALRGLGEGQRPMNDARKQTMTNATVVGPAAALGGDRVKVVFPGGEAVLVIGKNIPVVRIEDAQRGDLKPGVRLRLQGGADQKINRITIQ